VKALGPRNIRVLRGLSLESLLLRDVGVILACWEVQLAFILWMRKLWDIHCYMDRRWVA
jgi:hypothetical protein